MPSKRIALLFSGLAVLHLMLFCLFPRVLPLSFWDRLGLFSINSLPWRPLHELGLPVSTVGWLTSPNLIGWSWCVVVWIGFYFAMAWLIRRYIWK